MTENEFAHGSYGDDSGVVFYGPPVDGFWNNRMAVSDKYFAPLLKAILDRAMLDGSVSPPRLAQEWNEMEGWVEGAGIQELSSVEAMEFVGAIRELSKADLAPHAMGTTPEACLRCASAVAAFIHGQIARGASVYVESD